MKIERRVVFVLSAAWSWEFISYDRFYFDKVERACFLGDQVELTRFPRYVMVANGEAMAPQVLCGYFLPKVTDLFTTLGGDVHGFEK